MNVPHRSLSRRTVVAASLYALASLVCTQIPLLNYLGYEFSTVIAVLGSLIAGFSTSAMVKTAYRGIDGSPPVGPSATMRVFGKALSSNLLLLSLPLSIAALNGFFVRNCSVAEGLSFFALIPVVSVVFSSCLGLLCAVHERHSRAAFVALLLVSLMYDAALGYVTPAIYSYNFFYGYFPGFTYDEVLTLNWTLVLFRLLTLLIGLLLWWLARLILYHIPVAVPGWRRGVKLLGLLLQREQRLLTVLIVVILALLYIYRCPLGFESTASFIQQELGSSYRTDHFMIYYAQASYSDEEIRRVGAEHEFRLKQILDAFSLQKYSQIDSYIYPSSETKRRLIGAGVTNIAKPWKNEIHLTQQTLDGTLKHELIHIVAGRFGVPVVRASLRPGLVEGVAMAIDWNWGHRTLHQYSSAMRQSGIAPDIRGLMTFTGFASRASSVSYVLAGSFCRYLIDRYGIRRMMQLYRAGDYEQLYGRSLDELIGEWQRFLDRVPVDDHDRDAVEVLFRRPPIFGKVCARVVASRNEEARERFTAKDYETARILFGKSYAEARAYDALGGYLASALHMGEYSRLVTLYDSLAATGEHLAQYLPIFLSIGDAFWATGDTNKARELYGRVRGADIAEGLTESSIVRLLALTEASTGPLFLHFFLSDADDTLRIARLDADVHSGGQKVLSQYLQGKVLLRLKRYEEAVEMLHGTTFAGTDPQLEAYRLRSLGRALFRLGRYQDARAEFWTSLNYDAKEVAVNDVNTWVERCDWMSAHGY